MSSSSAATSTSWAEDPNFVRLTTARRPKDAIGSARRWYLFAQAHTFFAALGIDRRDKGLLEAQKRQITEVLLAPM